jgi:hypothetical protein
LSNSCQITLIILSGQRNLVRLVRLSKHKSINFGSYISLNMRTIQTSSCQIIQGQHR